MVKREPWIDAARGFALCLVVLLHASTVPASLGLHVSPRVTAVNGILDGFRMPTLLMLSGLLARSVREWPWREVLRRRVGPLMVLYFAWGAVCVVAMATLRPPHDLSTIPRDLGLVFVRPYIWAWYLAALAMYIALARALRAVPTAVIVPIAIALSLAAYSVWPTHRGSEGWHYWLFPVQHWVFFVCAERFAVRYLRVADRTRPALAMATSAIFVGIGALLWRAGLLEGESHARSAVPALAFCAVGTLVSLTVFPLIGPSRLLGWARAVGRNSLGIYGSQAIYAAALAALLSPIFATLHIFGRGILAPVIVAVGAVALAYATTLGA